MSIEYVASGSSERGDVVLRRRADDGALELRVNGVFVMDTMQTSSERLLARLALEAATVGRTANAGTRPREPLGAQCGHPPGQGLKVLIGGLGLGFTLNEVLSDERVEEVIIVEIEPSLVAWHEEGLVPGSRIGDKRVEVVIGDVRDVVGDVGAGAFAVVLLDVDNGPGYLVYPENTDVYGISFLQTCRDALHEGGVLALWAADSSAPLLESINRVFGHCEERAVPVRLGRRDTTYNLALAVR